MNGVRVTERVILERMGELGIDNPTKENFVMHWKKHCEVVSSLDEADRARLSVEEMLQATLGEDWRTRVVKPDEALPLIANQLWQQIADRMVTGQSAGGLIESYQRVCAEMNRRKADGAAFDLAEMLGQSAEEPALPLEEPELEREAETEALVA